MAKSASNPEFATAIVRRLQEAGHVAYFAGGCVRDQLLGRSPADYDVATSAHPEQVMDLFGRSQQVGVSFGVVLVRQKQQTVEVATFRSDGQYSDGRRPDHVEFSTAQVDAQRRDFTCNGLFFDPIAQELHDFVGGQTDIQARILRAIGRAEQRFAEDYLRLLRAPRFAAKLGFEIEPVTLQAIRAGAAKIRQISKERIGEELRMMLEHPARVRAAELLVTTGLLDQIWPEPLHAGVVENPSRDRQGAVNERSDDQPLPYGRGSDTAWPTLAALPEPPPVTRSLALAAMQLDLQPAAMQTWEQAPELLRDAFLLSNDETAALRWIGQKLPQLGVWPTLRVAVLKRLCADGHWRDLYALWQAQTRDSATQAALAARLAELTADPAGIAPVPFITGNDLMALGAQPGPNFKRWLEELYDRQLENEFRSRVDALDAAKALLSGT